MCGFPIDRGPRTKTRGARLVSRASILIGRGMIIADDSDHSRDQQSGPPPPLLPTPCKLTLRSGTHAHGLPESKQVLVFV